MVSVQHLLDQCRHHTTIVFGNLGRWPDRVTIRLKVLSRGLFPVSLSLGVISASKYGGLPFGSHALHATGGRVRDLVGRLGNASRREPTSAYGVSPTLEMGFGNTCGTLESESFGPWDALLHPAPRAYIRQATLLSQIKQHVELTHLFCSCQRVSSPE
ncbi:hypothetical protein TNCV_1936661 [Trichonephila clavipes]|nr:hypothetical protein TNCV_1936661 [Trichonephila clavipes]